MLNRYAITPRQQLPRTLVCGDDAESMTTGVDKSIAQGRLLEYFTIGWNSLEAIISIAAGSSSGSISLLGFGLDSLIEVCSGGAVLWRLRRGTGDHCADRQSLRVVGGLLLALAVYIAADSARALWFHEVPRPSIAGIAIAVAAMIVMPLLARAKRRVAGRIDSRALQADARQADFCGYLSAFLLAGLMLNAWLGWWWADPVAGLAMVPIIAREGRDALRGKSCGCSEPQSLSPVDRAEHQHR